METKRKTWPNSIRTITAFIMITWLVLPLLPLFTWSFARGWYFPDLVPRQWTLKAWAFALSQSSGVLDSLWVTTAIAATTTLLSIAVGIPAGRALGLYQFRGKTIVELAILAPVIVPGIAVVFGIHSVFIGLGLTNTVVGVILVHLIPTLPYMILVMSGIFANFDTSFEAQARSLGASAFQTFWHVTLPAIMPGVIIGGLFSFLVSWSQYILTLTIGGGRVVTLPLLLFNFATSGRNDITGTIGVIYILPGLIVILFVARFLSGRNRAIAALGRA